MRKLGMTSCCRVIASVCLGLILGISVINAETVSTTPALIAELAVNDSSRAADWSMQKNIQVGSQLYADRPFTVQTLPSAYAGLDWIRGTNDSKKFRDEILLTFTVTAEAEVYVAHDDRIATRPAWLSTWTDTGDDMTILDDKSNPVTFSIFKASYPANAKISLGNNGSTSGCCQYAVLVKAKGAVK